MAFFLFTNRIFKGEPIDVYNHGDLMRDFTYIDDLVEAIRRLIDTPPVAGQPVMRNDSLSPVAPYRLVNIGHAAPVRLMDYIEAIEQAGLKPQTRYQCGKVFRDGRFKMHDISVRMPDRQPSGMQHQARCTLCSHPIQPISKYGHTRDGQVRADLMHPTGFRTHLNERCISIPGQYPPVRCRSLRAFAA